MVAADRRCATVLQQGAGERCRVFGPGANRKLLHYGGGSWVPCYICGSWLLCYGCIGAGMLCHYNCGRVPCDGRCSKVVRCGSTSRQPHHKSCRRAFFMAAASQGRGGGACLRQHANVVWQQQQGAMLWQQHHGDVRR